MDGVFELGGFLKSKVHLFLVDKRSYPHIVKNSELGVGLEIDFGLSLCVDTKHHDHCDELPHKVENGDDQPHRVNASGKRLNNSGKVDGEVECNLADFGKNKSDVQFVS